MTLHIPFLQRRTSLVRLAASFTTPVPIFNVKGATPSRPPGRAPAPFKGTADTGVAFLLLTFLWRSKEKPVARRDELPANSAQQSRLALPSEVHARFAPTFIATTANKTWRNRPFEGSRANDGAWRVAA